MYSWHDCNHIVLGQLIRPRLRTRWNVHVLLLIVGIENTQKIHGLSGAGGDLVTSAAIAVKQIVQHPVLQNNECDIERNIATASRACCTQTSSSHTFHTGLYN